MEMDNKEKKILTTLIEKANESNIRNLWYNSELIIEFLKNCELHLDYPQGYTHNTNRDPITFSFKYSNNELVEDIKFIKDKLIALCIEVLDIDGNYELSRDEYGEYNVKFILVTNISKLPEIPKVTFERCKDLIIKWIGKAKHSIYAAVAWLTNPDIMSALQEKANSGVIIFILVDAGNENDNKNKMFLSTYKRLNFPVCFVVNKNGCYWNTMHHKFCIIDEKTVLHGTFNWTKKAEYNEEDVTVDENESIVNEYLDRFIALRAKHSCFFEYDYQLKL